METKYITIPFQVERAKRITSGVEPGKIVTRDGRGVRVVCWDAKGDNPIIALIEDENCREWPYSYLNNGSYNIDISRDIDLMLSVPEWATYKDGDIIYCEVDNGDSGVCKWVSILKGKVECFSGDLYTDEYATCIIESNTCKGEMSFDGYADNIDTIVLANESQKQYIIEAIKESKEPKAKEYLKRFFGIEEKKEFDFKPFDKVLVRDDDDKCWIPSFYWRKGDSMFRAIGGSVWNQCIPYNDQTKHLLGTSNDPE